MRFLLRYLELILSAAGIAVIIAVPTLFFPEPQYRWLAVAVTATAVGLIHGLIFFAVRHRQRSIRHQTIREMQLLVDDLVRNQLAVISLSTEIASDMETLDTDELHAWARQAYAAARKIDQGLKEIDSDGLTRTAGRYQHLISISQNS